MSDRPNSYNRRNEILNILLRRYLLGDISIGRFEKEAGRINRAFADAWWEVHDRNGTESKKSGSEKN